ncbi:unnamed protein product [Arabidopsis lyrata]|nr:unnamed protein product [Arabidopsis lyrata]
MAIRLPLICLLVSVTAIAADLTPELLFNLWTSYIRFLLVLHNYFLYFTDVKSTNVQVGKGGVNVNAGKGKPGGGTAVNVGKGGVYVPERVSLAEGHTRRDSSHPPQGQKPVYVAVKPGPNPFVYNYAASKTQLHDDPKAALFFLEKDMFPGKAMNLRFNAEDGCGGVKKLSDDKSVVCHKQKYPFAVFYCHKAMMTSVYAVPLEGENGMRAKAVAVCHKNTSAWNPNHLAFKVLKVKPGTVPVFESGDNSSCCVGLFEEEQGKLGHIEVDHVMNVEKEREESVLSSNSNENGDKDWWVGLCDSSGIAED